MGALGALMTIMVSPRLPAAEEEEEEEEARRILNESTGIPEVLFLISTQYVPFITNEISNIMQLVFPSFFVVMCFHYCPRHYAYFELLCQRLISVQIIVPLFAEGEELRIFGHPVCEMILGKNSEMGAL